MSSELHRRQFIRAPLKTYALYDDERFGFKAKILNISEGGILLEDLPHVPAHSHISLLLDIPSYPLFSSLSLEKIKKIDRASLTRHIIRVQAQIMRSFEGQSEVDKIFVQKIGCQFQKPSPEIHQTITQYVSTFSRNMIYLLTLFESTTPAQAQLIQVIAPLLGYCAEEDLLSLRQKILHDYQSIDGP